MKISLSFAKLLRDLGDGKEIMQGAFQGNSRKLLEQFLLDQILDYHPVGTQQKRIYCVNKENLRSYLHHKFGIPSLELYIDFLLKEDIERSQAVKAASDSKIRNVKIFEGFLFNTYEDLNGILNGKEIGLRPTPGSFTFINDYKAFSIPSDITVIVVEGFENFKYVDRQKYLFEGLRPLFIWRYQNSSSISDWLNIIPNTYLHFGDFDPKGIHIYLSEFRSKIAPERCNFFIPPNVEELILNYGDSTLFNEQMEYLKNYDFNNFSEILPLLNILKKLKMGLEQEVLINNVQ